MSKRFCKCPNEHCFDHAIQCVSCDPEDLDTEGYPSKARRRLTNEENGMVQDVDDKQWFKVKKVKGSKRLVPQFKGRMDWKSAKGFAAMCLILSCLGAEGEYVLWDDATSEEMTEKEWRKRKFGSSDKPPFRHRVCEEVVTSTCINTLQRGKSIGCGCKKKTEAKLRPWLEKKFPEATVNTQYRGPKTDRKGQTHFDFHLTFPDRFEVLIELDGVHHFWSDAKFYTNEACERDLTKEKWAIAKGHSVVRVLQEDVWNDLNGWQGWLTEKIEAARSGEPRVFIPIAPEYLSVNSAYVQLRSPWWGWSDPCNLVGELRPIFRLTPVACTV
jgi:very-short-patch-repair endonuclease